MELNTFKIVSENYKNQEKTQKKNTNKTKKTPSYNSIFTRKKKNKYIPNA